MNQVFPGVWASNVPGRAKNALPIVIKLKEGKQPVRIKQYPLKKEDREGISPVIENFLQLGLLKECQSEFNTPILPVRKHDGSYRIVQDLRAVNKITEDLYPVVANPYTLLTCLTPELTWFTVLDLKDAFFCLPIHEDSQKIFAFEWENPKSGRKSQLTWSVLPQGFKNSPTLFGEQLAKDLESWEAPPEEGKLLQYVDDILIATRTKEACVAWTVSLLNFLGLQGYRVSKKKAQVVKQKVIYLGYEISAGQRTLGQDRKEAICQTPRPQTVKELRTFLGMTGWCRLWIHSYGLLVKPLYALITNGNRNLQWTKEATQAFHQLKNALMSAPALGLPNVSKPFFLFSHEKQGIALGILAQDLGPYRRAVAYFSKQLDTTAKGWPGCLRAVAAVVLNIQEARKFTLGQKMTVFVSHTVSAVLEVKGGHWLSPQRFLKYQAIMVEQDDVEIVVTNIINPASFLSGNQGEPVHHDCLETIEASYSSRPDLKDTPLDDAETWFTDGSSYVISGKRHAGYAVTTCRKVIESGPLPTDTSAQKAEIIALTRALEIAKGRKVNIYTDSRYAFGVVHAHGAIWKERGLLNSQGKNIKHSQEILRLLEAVQLPEQVAIMHIKAHQKVSSELEEGNELADREAKEAAKGEITIEGALIPDGQVSLEGKPVYTRKDRKLIQDQGGKYNQEGWAITAVPSVAALGKWLDSTVSELVQRHGPVMARFPEALAGHCHGSQRQLVLTIFGSSSGIWPRLKRDRRWDGRSPFGPPGQVAKREQPGTGNDEERQRVSIPAAGKGDVRVGVRKEWRLLGDCMLDCLDIEYDEDIAELLLQLKLFERAVFKSTPYSSKAESPSPKRDGELGGDGVVIVEPAAGAEVFKFTANGDTAEMWPVFDKGRNSRAVGSSSTVWTLPPCQVTGIDEPFLYFAGRLTAAVEKQATVHVNGQPLGNSGNATQSAK
ncbi:uncharacterized protein LOC131378806, partial [Hirundo rustica]|uniref:uncharacterized protein LOC131378806 n=1 Tax=Hirundo rustica TaxID=43150 RepID=UPI0026721E83